MTPSTPVSQLVVIGSSAGGIEALSALVANLPVNFPAPLVVAQHLDPTRPSHLEAILGRRGPLPVRTVVDHAPLEAGVIYVVPANRHVSLSDHHLEIDQEGKDRPRPSIDLLFQSAAAIFEEGLIAVVLSGLGSDGANGARRVKEAGGMVIIQNPRTANFPSMPLALAPTLVDMVADAGAIGPLLYDLLTGVYAPVGPADDRQLRVLLSEVQNRTEIDFTRYKPATIRRRLERRLVATGMRTLTDYKSMLEVQPEEFDRLVNAFLIKVTEFFRDPDLFAYLRTTVIPALVTRARAHGHELRFWSAGCATGEEAYSLAMLVAEALGDELDHFSIRIFATDLDHEAIEFGRRAIYPTAALADIPPELVARFCKERDGMYELTKAVRGLVVFGEHDLGQRSPFPRIDLCLCRNVLIYFTAELQQRVLELFVFALRDGAYLVLGKAETTGPLPAYFTTAEPALKVYRRQGERMLLPVSPGRASPTTARREHSTVAPASLELARLRRNTVREQDRHDDAEELLLRLPVGIVVVDRRYDVRRLNSEARRLLGIHGEAMGEDILHLARRAPSQPLRAAIDAALRGEEYTIEEFPISTVMPGETRYLRVISRPEPPEPANDQEARALLVVADVTAEVEARRNGEAARAEIGRQTAALAEIATVNREILAANEQLTSVHTLLRRANEEQLLGGEEIQAAAEELETLNEELQATNEELETLNEEQQATVEELETTNEELSARHHDIRELADSLDAQRLQLATVLESMGEAVVAIDSAGQVIVCNALFKRIFGFSDLDFPAEDPEGRPLPPEEHPVARLRRGDSFRMEFTMPGPDGGRRWFEAIGRPVDDHTKPRDAVLVIRDITDRTLRRLQDQFLALATHELRTPLTAILGSLELLVRRAQHDSDPARLAESAVMAYDAARKLQRLVNDLVDVSRLTNGKLRLAIEPIDLTAVTREAMEMAHATAGEYPLRLDGANGPLMVRGDSTRLRQVLLNLLDNAFTHAPEAPVEVHVRREDGAAEVRVTDQGPGIEPEALPYLFKRFYQAADAGLPPTAGMGLGLYIAREIVEGLGGEITVRSVVGEGTAFTVRMPLLETQVGNDSPR